MAGYSAVLPIRKDPNDGFALLQTIKEVASQNLKMVLYTEPGERRSNLSISRFIPNAKSESIDSHNGSLELPNIILCVISVVLTEGSKAVFEILTK